MASTINASNSGFGGIVSTGDSSGQLQLQTAGTTALTIDTSQNATFAGTLTATGKLASSSMPTGSVLQVLQTTKTDIFSTTSTTMVDITGLSISITPSSTSNKILVLFSGSIASNNNQNSVGIQLSRGGSALFVGDAAGSRVQATAMAYSANVDTQYPANFSYLDSPATTSSTTYTIQMRCNSTGTAYLSRSSADANTVTDFRTPASIIVMEIKG
jgi:hypothetical protein